MYFKRESMENSVHFLFFGSYFIFRTLSLSLTLCSINLRKKNSQWNLLWNRFVFLQFFIEKFILSLIHVLTIVFSFISFVLSYVNFQIFARYTIQYSIFKICYVFEKKRKTIEKISSCVSISSVRQIYFNKSIFHNVK